MVFLGARARRIIGAPDAQERAFLRVSHSIPPITDFARHLTPGYYPHRKLAFEYLLAYQKSGPLNANTKSLSAKLDLLKAGNFGS